MVTCNEFSKNHNSGLAIRILPQKPIKLIQYSRSLSLCDCRCLFCSLSGYRIEESLSVAVDVPDTQKQDEGGDQAKESVNQRTNTASLLTPIVLLQKIDDDIEFLFGVLWWCLFLWHWFDYSIVWVNLLVCSFSFVLVDTFLVSPQLHEN